MAPDQINEGMDENERKEAIGILKTMIAFEHNQSAQERGDDMSRNDELKQTARAYLDSLEDPSAEKLDQDSERLAKTFLRDFVRSDDPETKSNPELARERQKKIRDFVQKL